MKADGKKTRENYFKFPEWNGNRNILRAACKVKIFLRRFFQQQFKRSCSPDGVQATCISLSPRGAWQMPSDTIAKLWLK